MIEFILDNLITLWVLCSLVTFLLLSIISRRVDHSPMEIWDRTVWASAIIISILFPVGLIGMFGCYAWPWLIKERTYKRTKP